ncbi:MAG: aminopeptidase [Planctomycetaceae bacterium]|nr:aminopeptidase [Planctomycetaceae bacterium]
MRDPRVTTLADLLIGHSCQLKAGDKVLIEAFDLPDDQLVCRLIEAATQRGAAPFVLWKRNAVQRALYQHSTADDLKLAGELERIGMERMDAYIGIRGAANSTEMSDVPAEQLDLYQQHWWKPVADIRLKRRWVVLRYPTPAMAQSAQMSTEAFEDYYFDVCTADYAQMAVDQEPLRKRMLAADRVHVKGPGTDLQFSIQGIGVVPCNGRRNIPDGEVYTAPVRDSVNGVVTYNTPSLYQGTIFNNVSFEFRDGQIVKAECANATDRLNNILDSDDGARYLGEWSLGCNNRVRKPMLDTLFDEKIGGSFHLTPGNAYETADNGNRSRVHWDLVCIQTPEYGGGEVWFDGEMIRKDGRFLPNDLQPLNAGLE